MAGDGYLTTMQETTGLPAGYLELMQALGFQPNAYNNIPQMFGAQENFLGSLKDTLDRQMMAFDPTGRPINQLPLNLQRMFNSAASLWQDPMFSPIGSQGFFGEGYRLGPMENNHSQFYQGLLDQWSGKVRQTPTGNAILGASGSPVSGSPIGGNPASRASVAAAAAIAPNNPNPSNNPANGPVSRGAGIPYQKEAMASGGTPNRLGLHQMDGVNRSDAQNPEFWNPTGAQNAPLYAGGGNTYVRGTGGENNDSWDRVSGSHFKTEGTVEGNYANGLQSLADRESFRSDFDASQYAAINDMTMRGFSPEDIRRAL